MIFLNKAPSTKGASGFTTYGRDTNYAFSSFTHCEPPIPSNPISDIKSNL
jgi:hypothetical protein